MSDPSPTIAFLGAGRMARAIVQGLIQQAGYAPAQLRCISAADGTGEQLRQATEIALVNDPAALLAGTDVLVLAIKPQQLASIDAAYARAAAGKLVISILAGTPLQRLQTAFPAARAVVRAMPNTPGQIGAGVTAYAVSAALSPSDQSLVEQILGALGKVYAVEEPQLDAVTALSGSGPAYVFEFVAGLRDAGVAAGLSAELSYQLALQTALGAAQLLQAVPEKPETHRDWVSSPGGTTLAGLAELEAGGLRGLLNCTVAAAKRRSIELAQG